MKEYSPLTYSEASHYADLCKRSTREEAETMQRFLMKRALATGATSTEVQEAIQSITDRFIEEDREMRRRAMEDEMLRSGVSKQQKIDADDGEIVEAIKKTIPQFQSDRDWAGIYRILVDFCDFPPKLSDFVRRFDRMGIYPTDDAVKGLEKRVIPAINEHDYCGHRFSYQALQKGLNQFWPQTYWEWLNHQSAERDFVNRRTIATTFFKELKAEAGA